MYTLGLKKGVKLSPKEYKATWMPLGYESGLLFRTRKLIQLITELKICGRSVGIGVVEEEGTVKERMGGVDGKGG